MSSSHYEVLAQLLDEYVSGSLQERQTQIEKSLSLSVSSKAFSLDKITSEWDQLLDMQRTMSEYLRAGTFVPVDLDADQVHQALESAAHIHRLAKSKQEAYVSSLESVVITASETLLSTNPKELKKTKETIQKVRATTQALNVTGLYNASDSLLAAYDAQLTSSIQGIAAKKTADATAESIINDATTTSYASLSTHQLRRKRKALDTICRSSYEGSKKNLAHSTLQAYDQELNRRHKSFTTKILKTSTGVVVGGALLLGLYAGGSALYDTISLKRTERRARIEESRSHLETILSRSKALEQSISSQAAQANTNQHNNNQHNPTSEKTVSSPSSSTSSSTSSSAHSSAPVFSHQSQELQDEKLLRYVSGFLSDGMTALYVERDSNTSYLVSRKANTIRLLGSFPHTDSFAQVRKTRSGVPGNPEGVYAITRFEERSYHDNTFGSILAYINYPTKEESLLGFSGGGVQLVGYESGPRYEAIVQGKDSMHSGVGFRYDDLQLIRKAFEENRNSFRIIIEDHKKRPLYNVK